MGQYAWGVVTRLNGSGSLLFRDSENWDVDIRGGALDDSFVMSGRVLAANVSIDGGLGEDILIGGRINDSSLSNLNDIRTVWMGDSAYDSRVSLLRDTRLSDDKVTGNGERDTLTGGFDALDLFFGDAGSDLFEGDLVTDWQDGEEIVPLM